MQQNVLHDSPADKFQVIFCYFISGMFGFSTSVLLGFHIYLVCWNRTTLGQSVPFTLCPLHPLSPSPSVPFTLCCLHACIASTVSRHLCALWKVIPDYDILTKKHLTLSPPPPPPPSPLPPENMQYPVYEGSPHRRLYHLGVRRNLQQVFGKNCFRALLPVFTG